MNFWTKNKKIYIKFNVQGSVHRKYIPIYSYIQQDATSHSLFLSGNCSTCFGWRYHPKHVEQFPDINKLCDVAYFWIYIGKYIN